MSRIDEATALFTMGPVEREGCITAFAGLLVPNENYVVAYGRAALEVCGVVHKELKTRNADYAFRFLGSIASIDDSGVAFVGPYEGEKAAVKRCDAFKAFIEKKHPMMPTLEEVEEWGKRNGVYPDFY